MKDLRVELCEIAETVCITAKRVHNILFEKLHMKKICARWVPRLLIVDQKRTRQDISTQRASMFKRILRDFLRRFVTMDETWIDHYTSECKQRSKKWTMNGERVSKKAKTVPSVGKVMATVFWDSEGIILIDHLEKGKTITGDDYAIFMVRLKEELKQKRPRLVCKKFSFIKTTRLLTNQSSVWQIVVQNCTN